ncbi:Disease resistance protein RGA2, putative [Ricinus communis]|uniref:Disease resistance protein RGA2, putative n=1 Tax=Ricinus communis TaxID=3988 RepID=B9RV81_RICCO|nr:Disease resistance protein RGA2, putative [Ricinus communis]
MDALGLSMRKGIGQKPSSQKTRTTAMLDDEYGIRGRNEDKELILRSFQTDCNGLGVICIVGMGGIGKTTLAQLVYNDYRIMEWFDVKAWVHVSEEFDETEIMKDILKEVTTDSCNLETLNVKNELGFELKKRLEGKKFILIMDDVWNDNYCDWRILCSSLQTGVQGSKVVITTRNESISSMMDDQDILYRLNELSDDDCWLLFAEHAFDDGDSNNRLDLETVGRKIVRKCKGLPLAAKTIGSLLCLKRDVDEWERVLNNNMWDLVSDNILPALALSYHYLPSHLKRCFAYCAVFPKGYKFLKDELIRLWMAEGFLMQSKGCNKDIELIGDEYFCELVSRSFFQQSTCDMPFFVMHDLIHDLANFISGEFCLRFPSSAIPSRTRHLSHGSEYGELEGMDGYLPLRTLLYVRPGRMYDSSPSWKKYGSFLLLNRLRVLSLPRWGCETKLPDSIGN